MEKDFVDLIDESRDERGERTGESSAHSDFDTQKTHNRKPSPRRWPVPPEEKDAPPVKQKKEKALEPEPEPEPSGLEALQGLHSRSKFVSTVKDKLGSSLSAKQRSAIAKELAGPRSGGLKKHEVKKALGKLRDQGVIKNKTQEKIARRKLLS